MCIRDRVIDIGCGCGATSLAISELGAAVTGVDVSMPMLNLARTRAKKVSFIKTDASTYQSDQKFDLVFSRFGVMFFSDPYKAFSNLHSIAADNGRLAFVCWQAPQKNPWMAIPGQVIRPFLPESEAQPDLKAPGPFAFADPIYLEDILLKSEFKDPAIADFKSQLHIADSIEEAVFFQTKIGPGARVLAEIDDPEIKINGAAFTGSASDVTNYPDLFGKKGIFQPLDMRTRMPDLKSFNCQRDGSQVMYGTSNSSRPDYQNPFVAVTGGEQMPRVNIKNIQDYTTTSNGFNDGCTR